MKRIFSLLIALIITVPLFSQNTGITVVTPNGGEYWTIGCPNTISWITTTPAPVKIELYKNGVFYMTIATQVPATQNSFTWILPNSIIPANTYKVKVTKLINTVPSFDFSNANFTIGRGNITVLTPNGGEVIPFGSTYLITWNDNFCQNVRIELWKAGNFFSLIAPSVPSTGSFAWAITNSIPAGNNYKIKIIKVEIAPTPNSQVLDFSNNYFTIGGQNGCFVTVTSPNGGEVWARGTTHLITWVTNATVPVRIELWKGGTFHSLITASAPNGGTFTWNIPTTIPGGQDYKIRVITMINSGTITCADYSDNNFSIVSTTVTPAKPVGFTAELYPNPCNDKLTVKPESELLSPVTVDLYDLMGRILISQKADEPLEMVINTSGLIEGYYVLVVKQGGNVLIKKPVVVKH